MKPNEAIERFCKHATASLANATFARLVLSSPVGGEVQKILGRFVMIKGAPHISLTLREATRDVTKNIPVGEAGDWLRGQLGASFRSALLCTTKCDWQLITKEDGDARLIDHQPSAKKPLPREHDERRQTFLDVRAHDWLQGLGILDRDGKLRASMADKHRQISHYLEIISHLAKECGWGPGNIQDSTCNSQISGTPGPTDGNSLGIGRSTLNLECSPIHFADMGCGKGYLTFGLWHLFHRIWKQPVHVAGVETRADLVATTNRLARQIQATGLEFIRGDIATAKLSHVDALIALHACNTATDDAIRRGIELGAKLIVVAPCCHKELRAQLGKPGPLAPVLRHGLMAERMAEWTTDGLRALFLEWAGYRTKLMEFVGSEHTPKNLMIAAVREREAFTDERPREQIETLKNFFGIEHHALDKLLEKTQTAS